MKNGLMGFVYDVEWYEDGEGSNTWICECGFAFQLTNGDDPIQNGMKFCPGCGNRITITEEYEIVSIKDQS